MLLLLVFSLNFVWKDDKFSASLFIPFLSCLFFFNLCQQESVVWVECIIINIFKKIMQSKTLNFAVRMGRYEQVAAPPEHLELHCSNLISALKLASLKSILIPSSQVQLVNELQQSTSTVYYSVHIVNVCWQGTVCGGNDEQTVVLMKWPQRPP